MSRSVSVAIVVGLAVLLVLVTRSSSAPAPTYAAGASREQLSGTVGEPRYLIMIDAGSSGSRLHVHKWTWPKGTNPSDFHAIPRIEPSVNKKIKPGLSSYAENPEDAGESMLNLIEFAKETVPKDQWSRTPIHLQATAGLRSVSPAARAAILDSVRVALSASPFPFKPEWARVLSGTSEGVNAWLAVNYLMGTFDKAAVLSSDDDPSNDYIQSFGVIEMGGASLQMTFQPTAPVVTRVPRAGPERLDDSFMDPLLTAPPPPQQPSRRGTAEGWPPPLPSPSVPTRLEDYHIELMVAGLKFNLYTYSYLNYGLDAVQELFQHTHRIVDEVDQHGNPCYPRSFRHSSAGDYDRCLRLLREVILDKEAPCPFPAPHATCSFNGIYQPPVSKEPFLAIENFFYTSSFFGVHNLPQFVAGLQARGRDFCARDWRNITAAWPEESKADLSKYCFATAYMPVLLEHGFNLPVRGPATATASSEAAEVRVTREISGRPIDWPLGAVLWEILRARNAASSRPIAPGVGAAHALSSLLISMCLFAVPATACWVVYKRIYKSRAFGRRQPMELV